MNIKLLLVATISLSATFANAQWKQRLVFSGSSITCFAFSGKNIFVGIKGSNSNNGFYISTDKGDNWTAFNNGMMPYERNILSMTVCGNSIFAGMIGTGVFRSIDTGKNWIAVNTGLKHQYISSMTTNGTRIFAGTDSFVYLSTNNGNSWAKSSNGLPKGLIISLVTSGSNIFASFYKNAEIYMSSDNGSSWNLVNNGLPKKCYTHSLYASGTKVFALVNNDSVYLTTNNGANWTFISNGLTGKGNRRTCMAVNGSNYFVGGIGADKVVVSSNNGGNWAAVDTGFTGAVQMSALAINGATVFAGTAGHGVWTRPLNEMALNIGAQKNTKTGIYPNPTNGKFTIVNSDKVNSVKVYDMLGEVVYEVNDFQENLKNEIDLSQFSKGVYLVSIHAGGVIFNEKLQIE